METYSLKFLMSGIQNAERYISQSINNLTSWNLSSVDYNIRSKFLELYFNKCDSFDARNIVKQLSKKKNTSVEEFISKKWRELKDYKLVSVIELKDYYLLFFQK